MMRKRKNKRRRDRVPAESACKCSHCVGNMQYTRVYRDVHVYSTYEIPFLGREVGGGINSRDLSTGAEELATVFALTMVDPEGRNDASDCFSCSPCLPLSCYKVIRDQAKNKAVALLPFLTLSPVRTH